VERARAGAPDRRACHLAIVNGAYGIVVAPRGAVIAAIGITTVDGRISAFEIVADPAKLPAHLVIEA
jgi:RNA polymerase sigma-70 factor (ECF subfamily)